MNDTDAPHHHHFSSDDDGYDLSSSGAVDPHYDDDNNKSDSPLLFARGGPAVDAVGVGVADAVDFEDPKIAALPRVLLMGPRRSGKTSIQVRKIEME